jgi:prevent-host-death family protein
MPRSTWSIQDAKNHFSEVVRAAEHEPQTVTRHGDPAVVVIAADEYMRLREVQRIEAASFADHLLAMPNDDGAFERLSGDLRDVNI